MNFAAPNSPSDSFFSEELANSVNFSRVVTYLSDEQRRTLESSTLLLYFVLPKLRRNLGLHTLESYPSDPFFETPFRDISEPGRSATVDPFPVFLRISPPSLFLVSLHFRNFFAPSRIPVSPVLCFLSCSPQSCKAHLLPRVSCVSLVSLVALFVPI